MAPKRPQDYNAFGYDPRGTMANAAGLLFGENWRPDQQDIPRYAGAQVAAPRFGPPADYQVPYVPQNFAPQLPHNGYLGALQYQRREGPWANYPYADPAAQYPPHPPPLAPHHVEPARYPQANAPAHYHHVPASAAPPFTRPLANGEIRPGVFRMTAYLATPKVQKQFTFESDIDYIDFRSRACANLDIKDPGVELGYRIYGLEGPRTVPNSLDSATDFENAMVRICGMIQRARTKEYGIEVVNLNPTAPSVASGSASKSRKRGRNEDIPPDALKEETLTKEYKNLCNHVKCEACKGHCYVMRDGTHQRLDYKELLYWAKQNILGNSDVHNHPEAISFDRRAKRARLSSSSKNEIHVHNHFDNVKFGGSVLGNQGSARATLDKSSSPVHSPPPSSSVPTSPASFLESESSSFSTPVDLQEISLGDLLRDLDKSYSTGDYSAMSSALTDAGIKTAKGLTSRSIKDIVMWTALPLENVAVLHEYAIQRVTLDIIGDREVIRPPHDGGSTSESDVDSEVVDSSDIDGSVPE